MIDRILARVRARITRPDRIAKLTAELFAAELERDTARRAFHTATAECEHLRSMRDHHAAEAAALFALHSGAVEERDALRERLGIRHPAATRTPKWTKEDRLAYLQATWPIRVLTSDAIREAVAKLGPATSRQIAMDIADGCGDVDRRMRDVSDYARCGYLTVTKVKGVPHYSLPSPSNCDTCANDLGMVCKALPRLDVAEWVVKFTEDGRPIPNATNCPGYLKRTA